MKTVELQRGNRDEEVYGRLLRYFYIEDVFVNAELVAKGYARAYIFDPEAGCCYNWNSIRSF